MNTTTLKYSSSINIVRDNDYEFNYIPTPNSTDVFERLLLNATTGVKSQIIIGAYGTGKSSFLLAFQQTLKGAQKHFTNSNSLLSQAKNYDFIPIVGEYKSIIGSFAEMFGLTGNYASSDVINAIDKTYKGLKEQGRGVAFIIDEFGKFLEFASRNNPEAELYFLQQLAEWTNNTNKDALLICTLHQDFNAYSNNLNRAQQQEWDKVKGRFKELVFNEPVEQLLFLASKHLNNVEKTSSENTIKKLFNCIKQSKAFPLRDYFEIETAKKLYPLDILSAAVLTLALQRYGQNERSLFSFLESKDHLSISAFNKEKNGYYGIPQVYDYLLNNFYSILTLNNKNSDYNQWSGVRKALERLEGIQLQQPLHDAQQIIKTIGLLNIFASASAHLGNDFLCDYATLALGVKQPKEVIEELIGFKIIRYVNHNFRYTIFEGTDLNIDLAIDAAGKIVERVSNVVNQLNQFFAFHFIPAKAYYYEVGTPRLFQFKLSEAPIIETPEDEIDGFINLIFSEDEQMEEKVKETSKNCEDAILYGYYRNTTQIQNTLFEIQKVRKVIANNLDDKVAIKLLKDIEDHYVKLLNYQVMDSLYSAGDNIVWFKNGIKQIIGSRQEFNHVLSTICKEVYPNTPVFKNELINKTKVSSQIAGARKLLTTRLLNNLHEENLGFPADKFPPEKTIYLSLISKTGIHKENNGSWSLQKPTNKEFHALWEKGEAFLESSKGKQRNLQEFIEILLAKPFKLKQGFIDIWIPLFLLAKMDEYALFDSNGYIPTVNQDILDLFNKKPWLFFVKAFDVVGIKLDLFNRYRILLSQPENAKPNNKVFIQTIKPFLAFYKDLTAYSKKTQKLSKPTIALREVIANAKDPERTFFDEFPTALGYSMQQLQSDTNLAETYIKQLQNAIRELRTSYDELLNRFEVFIVQNILGANNTFPEYKNMLINRFKHVKTHLLSVQLKSFLNRINSALDDRASWLNSIAQACIGKSLMNITDEEEVVLYDKLSGFVLALDNFSEISKVDINEEEEIVKLEVTGFKEGFQKRLLHIPKAKKKDLTDKQSEIKAILGSDKKLGLEVLATLLQEYLQNE